MYDDSSSTPIQSAQIRTGRPRRIQLASTRSEPGIFESRENGHDVRKRPACHFTSGPRHRGRGRNPRWRDGRDRHARRHHRTPHCIPPCTYDATSIVASSISALSHATSSRAACAASSQRLVRRCARIAARSTVPTPKNSTPSGCTTELTGFYEILSRLRLPHVLWHGVSAPAHTKGMFKDLTWVSIARCAAPHHR